MASKFGQILSLDQEKVPGRAVGEMGVRRKNWREIPNIKIGLGKRMDGLGSRNRPVGVRNFGEDLAAEFIQFRIFRDEHHLHSHIAILERYGAPFLEHVDELLTIFI
jgi:hypothetical protein